MEQYQNASYLQILTTHQKTEADFKKIESAYLHLCGLHNILENRSENID
jgi:hypothetical protein